MHENYNLACAFYRRCLETPHAPAIICERRSLTYRELADRAVRIANCLSSAQGWHRTAAQPPRVGILATRGVDACVALLGACWAGATYVPLGLRQPRERLVTLLAQCELSALIIDDEGAKSLGERVLEASPSLVIHAGQAPIGLAGAGGRWVSLATLPSATLEEPAAMEASAPAYIIFTSGTTGLPKGVIISVGAARHYLRMIVDRLGLRASDRVLETCELSFDFSVHNVFSTWEAGAALHVLPSNLVMNAVKFARNARLTVWNSVPSLAGMLRQTKALAPDSLSTLRVTVFGGEQLPLGIVTAWRSAAPNSVIVNLYGPTEATVFCLAQTVGTPVPLTPGRDIVAIGTPLPGSEACVVDENGRPLGDNAPGELMIAGLQLAEGYLGGPDLTAIRFPTMDGKRWYRTGDLALRDGTGCFHCLGRVDNQIKILGYRVELEEIDAHLRLVSGADAVASVGWPLSNGVAQSVISFVGASTVDAARVIDALRTRIPPYMVPSRVIALEKMPLNSSGKVDRSALRRLLERLTS